MIPDGGNRRRLCDRLAVAVLAVLLAALLHGAWTVGPTFDEHFYIASGYAYWQEGDFALNREHPPLVKLLAALPLLFDPGVEYPEHALDVVNYPVVFFFQRNAAILDRLLFVARLPICLLTAGLGLVLYLVGRRFFGATAGLLALGLYAGNPNVLAHGRLVSLDAGVTPFLFLAVLAFLALLEWQPNTGASYARRALLAGVAFGLANLAKFTALILIPFFVAVAVVRAVQERGVRPLASLGLTFLAGLGVFAAGYGFEARSVNEAWARSEYVRDLPLPRRDVAAADLAAALRADPPPGREAAAEEALRLFDGAPDLNEAVVWLCGVVAGDDAARAEVAARALAGLEGGRGDLRKHAFGVVLGAGSLPEELRSEVLAALSGRAYGDLEAWRRFYAENRYESWDREVLILDATRALTTGILGEARPIPLFTAIKGLDQQLAQGKFGHGSYFRGRTLQAPGDFAEGNPHPEFYAVVMGVKNPLAALVLFLGGLGLAFAPRREGERWTLLRGVVLVGFPLAALLAFSLGNVLLGVRYLLPIFPFLCLLAGRVAVRWPRAAFALAGIALLESAWIHPDQLMYYNVLAGGPTGGPEITVVGDDWGQDARAVGRFYARHRDAIDEAGGLTYRPYTMADPEAFGLAGTKPHTGPTKGIVAVHEVDYRRAAAEFAWLREYEPFLRLGRSVRFYDTREPPPGGDPLEEWEQRHR
ncbi:MAG: phospholipid carrier-dependent glycosyltransferase [Planctomycetota bacterium]|nr:phospholipid carrier-dependent glycosyltransferase [Planctomycetota bacterium]